MSTPSDLVVARCAEFESGYADAVILEVTGVAGPCSVFAWRRLQVGRGLETASCRLQECCQAVRQVTHPNHGSHLVTNTACF